MPSFFVPLISGILIVCIGSTFLYFYLRNLHEEIVIQWHLLNDKTRLRIDKLPLLIETLRRFKLLPETLVEEIIQYRGKIWPLEDSSAQKVQLELSLSSKLHELWSHVEKEPILKNDIHVMALRKEIVDLGEEIDQMAETYNQKIYRYNKKIRFIFWRPLVIVFGFRRLPIFEFEV